MVKIAISGAGGRMGRQLTVTALNDPEIEVVGGIEAPGSVAIGSDMGVLNGHDPIGVIVTADVRQALASADVLVEFTVPVATVEHIGIAATMGKAAVLGTTGMGPEAVEKVHEACLRIPVVMSPNMSVGVNVLLRVLPVIAKELGAGYDVEIVEVHHKGKKDAPSGTALKLAEVVAKALGLDLEESGVYGRRGIAPRKDGEIGIHAVRAGANVGDHQIIFANEGEQVEVVHRVFSRQNFALGAMRAVKFVCGAAPGLYDMNDVLGS